MEKKALLFFVLAFLVVVIWPFIAQKIHPVKPRESEKKPLTEGMISKAVEKSRGDSDSVSRETVPAPLSTSSRDMNEFQKEVLSTVDTPLFHVEMSSHGASLKSWKLKHYFDRIGENRNPIDLVKSEVQSFRPLTLEIWIESERRTMDIPFHLENEWGSPEARRIAYSTQIHPGLRIRKVYGFYPDKYLVDLSVHLQNTSDKTMALRMGLSWTHPSNPSETSGTMEGHKGPIALLHNKREEIEIKDLKEPREMAGEVAWAGFEDKYFVAAMVPRQPNAFSWRIENQRDIIFSTIRSNVLELPPGSGMEIPFSIYVGPKEIDRLKAVGMHLEKALHFGWLDILAKPLLIALRFFHSYVGNFGLSIIVMTVIIKILFWPLATKSYKSMKEMQRIQPRILQIRERFKNNKEQLNRELMQLYRTHKVNPMGGCLPMLLQIPVFFALYYTLLGAIELRHAPFFLWIKDLSTKDPYYITPLVMGATMFIQQKMTPTAGDPLQAKIMLLMPIFFTFLFLNFPSGLVIYWLVNNLLSIGQQYYINRYTQ